ncbi:CdaR family transcriptional regulator [Terribacillus sp. DMT04]|uniref:PucR family transcriptional regulator n=1 Tax=Terribacillus sp. DMT04 TaxID=2850441 RepID=UPI001C2C1FED|nr:helix-turn-helix domain-containing protein [Terribacillus sp. DMT04]QXE02657.1 helix-turn-helix domain-containing protein [Terribacillus sp. DMT04]
MLDELEKMISGIIRAASTEMLDMENYHWFRLEDGDIIGFPKEQLNERELVLLHHLGSPITVPRGSSRDTDWYNLLHGIKDTNNFRTDPLYASGCRFIFFHLDGYISADVFREAMDSLSDYPLACVWYNRQSGLLIESRQKESISYEEVVDVVMYDLSVSLRLFVSPWLASLEDAPVQYAWLHAAYKQMPPYSAKHVLHFHDSIPQLLSTLLPNTDRNYIVQHILQGIDTDEELLRTIQTYFACNQNLTLTAKKLFIHRNSLHYRLEKLTERTGLDIRRFQDAFALYFAIQNM